MKKLALLLIFLLLSVVLIACNNDIQESQKKEDPTRVSKENTKRIQTEKSTVGNEEKFLPAFKDLVTPEISLLSSEGKMKYLFDFSYGEVCWNNCDEFIHYNYPSIHSGDVEVGDKIQIDWSTLKPQPTEIHLIHVDNSDEYDSKEVSRKQKSPENTPLTIAVDEEMIGNQYAFEFIWKDGKLVEGRSIMNFKLE
ncbi:hypothetical protein [Psychrobacillus sp. FSL H8-0510]|uniref:hypothetical protein n=1 Tax=Psychrobacillus sp. FSL H8-0510 TaxID=2921394 RepID=UPI0030F74BB0